MILYSFPTIIHRSEEVRTMIYKRFLVVFNTRKLHIYAYYCVFISPAEQQDSHYGIMQKDKWESQQIIFYLKNYDIYRKQHTVK